MTFRVIYHVHLEDEFVFMFSELEIVPWMVTFILSLVLNIAVSETELFAGDKL